MAARARGRPMHVKNHIHTCQRTLRRDAKHFGMVPTWTANTMLRGQLSLCAAQVQKARDLRPKHTPQTQEQSEDGQRQKIQNKPEPFEDNCTSRMCAGNMN